MGQVSFEINIVSPFEGVTLVVGGDVETYWKSMALPMTSNLFQTAPSRWPQPSGSIGSAQTSPSNHSTASSAGHALTISSLRGSYVYVVVQVTRDFHPVVYSNWLLPETDFDFGVADVTLAQFEVLAGRLGRDLHGISSARVHDWRTLIPNSMVSLVHLMKVRQADVYFYPGF